MRRKHRYPKKRKKPVKHDVHPTHPRYNVNQYDRGSGKPQVQTAPRTATITLDLTTPEKSRATLRDLESKFDKADTLDERVRIANMVEYASKRAKRAKEFETAGMYYRANRRMLEKIRMEMRGSREDLYREYKRKSLDQKRYLHSKRTTHAQTIDNALEARKKHSPETDEWERDMNRSDIEGVDYFPIPLSSELGKKQNFELNNDLHKVEYEDYLDHRFDPDIKIKKTKGQGITYLARYDWAKKELLYSIPVAETMEKGKIEDGDDFKHIASISHEYGHASRSESLKKSVYPTNPYTNSSKVFEEGSNEITSWRFTFHKLQMPTEVREQVRNKPSYFLAYENESRRVADLALLINDGNEEKAVNWIKDMRTEPHHREKIKKDMQKSRFYKSIPEEARRGVYGDIVERDLNKFLGDPSYAEYVLERNDVVPTVKRSSDTRKKPAVKTKYWYLLV
jgi:hypothetical protein